MPISSERVETLIAQLQESAADLSGYDTAELDPQETFLELGLDSLFLTQLATAYSKQFGIEVTFRQLFDELPTIAALAAHIDAALPPDDSSAEADAGAGDDTADQTGPTPAAAELAEPPSASSRVPVVTASVDGPTSAGDGMPLDTRGLESIFAQQLLLMTEQLNILQGAGAPAQGAARLISAITLTTRPPSSSIAIMINLTFWRCVLTNRTSLTRKEIRPASIPNS